MSKFKVDRLGYYRTRGGETMRVVCVDAGGDCPVVSVLDGAVCTHKENGNAWDRWECDHDLIAYLGETPEPAKGSLAWVRSLPEGTRVWNTSYAPGDSIRSEELLPDLPSYEDGWHIVGTAEWANALPEGTKVCRSNWKPGKFLQRSKAGWISHNADSFPLQRIVGDGWELYREPVIRPWKPEEVPVGAITRTKPSVNASNPSRQIITGENGVMIFVCGIPYAPDDLLARREHSLDHGKTWLPCGVEEESR